MITELMAHTIELLFLRDSDTSLFPGTRSNLPRFGSKPPVHPFGPGYSMHPELTRSGMLVMLSRIAPPVAIVTAYAASMVVEQAAIKDIVASENIDTNTKIRILSGY